MYIHWSKLMALPAVTQVTHVKLLFSQYKEYQLAHYFCKTWLAIFFFFVGGGGEGGVGGGFLPTPPVDRTLRSAVVKIVFYQSGG